MNELSDSPHSLHLSAGISGGRASDDPSRVAGGQLLRSDLAAVHATLAISRCARRETGPRLSKWSGAPGGGRQTDRRGKLDTFCLPQRLHLQALRTLTVRGRAITINQGEKWIDSMIIPQLAKFESKILNANRGRVPCPRPCTYPAPRSLSVEKLESCGVGLNQGQNKQIQSAFHAE